MNLCKPYRSATQAIFIIIFTALLALTSVAFSRFYPAVSRIFLVAAAVITVTGFGLLYRFSVMEFEYGLEGSVLFVRRFNGIKWRTVFSLKLTAEVELTTAKKECKKLKGVCHKQNLSAATAFVIYEQAGKKRYMEFEPNRIFYKIVRDKLGKIKEQASN